MCPIIPHPGGAGDGVECPPASVGDFAVSDDIVKKICGSAIFSPEELRCLLAAIAEADDVHRRLREVTASHQRDPSTGVGSEFYFQQRIRPELERYLDRERREHKSSYILGMLNVINLRSLNERLSYPVADDVVGALVRSVKSSLRSTDEIWRLPQPYTDCFGLLIRLTGDAPVLIDTILSSIPIRLQDKLPSNVTEVSGLGVGLVALGSHYDSVDVALAAAYDQLLQDKITQKQKRSLLYGPARTALTGTVALPEED